MPKGGIRRVQRLYNGCTTVVRGMHKGPTRSQHRSNAGATPKQHACAASHTTVLRAVPAVELSLPLPGNQVELRHYVSKTTSDSILLLRGRHAGRDFFVARRKPNPR